jgi:hypothetical protein
MRTLRSTLGTVPIPPDPVYAPAAPDYELPGEAEPPDDDESGDDEGAATARSPRR